MKSKPIQERNPRRYESSDYLRKLFAAGARASQLGLAVLDSQTRFESVTTSLARETRAPVDYHVGRTSREVVGDLAAQIEPTYEKVLRTGRSASIVLMGHVRDTPEYGYWLDHCFPVFDRSARIKHLGLFVINATVEKATSEILNALVTDPRRMLADAAGLLREFDETVSTYHFALSKSLQHLASPCVEAKGREARLNFSIQELDSEISDMRELIYDVISQFSVPRC